MRKWFKLFGHDLLFGSTLKELNYKEFSVWIELLCLACDSSGDGLVMARDGEGYTAQGLAYILKAPVNIVKTALDKLQLPSGKDNIPKINILDDNIIKINKWHIYQSEYSRQKQYRKPTELTPQEKYYYKKGMDKQRNWEGIKEKRTDVIPDKIKELSKKIVKEI